MLQTCFQTAKITAKNLKKTTLEEIMVEYHGTSHQGAGHKYFVFFLCIEMCIHLWILFYTEHIIVMAI